MRKLLNILALSVLAGSFASAQDATSQLKAAAKTGKTTFVLFHASWCGWCHKLEDFMATKEIKPIMDKHFTTLWWDVMEQGDKKSLETPGAAEYMKTWKATSAGLPWGIMLDRKGKAIGNMFKDGVKDNTGYPASADEIATFMKLLAKGAPKMTAAEKSTIENALVEAGKKINH